MSIQSHLNISLRFRKDTASASHNQFTTPPPSIPPCGGGEAEQLQVVEDPIRPLVSPRGRRVSIDLPMAEEGRSGFDGLSRLILRESFGNDGSRYGDRQISRFTSESRRIDWNARVWVIVSLDMENVKSKYSRMSRFITNL